MSTDNLPALRERSNALVPYGASEAEIEAANQRRKTSWARQNFYNLAFLALAALSALIFFAVGTKHFVLVAFIYAGGVVALLCIVYAYGPDREDGR